MLSFNDDDESDYSDESEEEDIYGEVMIDCYKKSLE